MAGKAFSSHAFASIVALVALALAVTALMGSLGYIGPRITTTVTETIVQPATTTFTKTVTAYLTKTITKTETLTRTRTVTVTITVTRTVYPTTTISKRVSTVTLSHIITKTLDLPVCRYEVFQNTSCSWREA